ncbi:MULTISPECIES: hypothetical protein [Thioclava]|uniref:AlgX/AlgJ SGNH hydrolase-like domain-containing protein n=1 Tax=Thioclava nitratireducens TaxID=1915078 RepID=A0ABN4XE81_9RHOB|nr:MULTISPECIES: hypothetical protein [Thioclava]AQS48589.1 hypothetical protein BMG03_12885 [Thioclava nitratireducens]OWY04682.1 hypothetical protein B6V75_00580 [Thioclava sp. F1Mire-8]OWY06285.1 hypothetical protein B6V76_00295 [Thioclava sp. IC9]OWY15086.1 hypothetical protein B6V72_00330 [Thioclava sp. F34-6]OWY18771.1 hypothetical protein B6V73_03030 [Thioclava sp. JM3]
MILRSLALAAGLLAAGTGSALAQQKSAYDCHGLATADNLPVLEGSDGFFYRLNLNMRTYHPLSAAAAKTVGTLSRVLAERGTKLIYVPIPTKSLAMPEHLPPEAADYGYDKALAQAGYKAFLSRLADANVTAIDTVAAMNTLPDDRQPFIGLDFHWSPDGAHSVAKAIADTIHQTPSLDDMKTTKIELTSTGTKPVESALRRHIQKFCRDGLPVPRTERFKATEKGGGSGDAGDIFAADSAGPPIALVGTSMSAEKMFSFEDALSYETQAQVANYSVTGGNQFGAITSYLLSEDFRENKPRVLIWENPIYNNLGGFGERPLRELIAAAGADCTPLKTANPDPNVLTADLPANSWTPESYLGVDTGRANGVRATLKFSNDDGLTGSTTIQRSERVGPTRWFYEYARPLWRKDYTHVRVELDQPAEKDATLSTCTLKGSQT